MSRLVGGLLTFAATVMLTAGVAAFHPPAGGKGGPPGKGDKRGRKGFQLGWVLPPHVKDEMELTADQDKKVVALERDVKAKLESILTPDQIKRLGEIGPPPMGTPSGPPRRVGE